MTAWWNNQFFLLAKGDWSDLIGIFVLLGFSVIGAIAKAWENRSRSGSEDKDETPPAVEKAKKYLMQNREKGRQMLSEWDRQQELRRQKSIRFQEREKPPQLVQKTPVKMRVVPEQPKPQVKIVRQPPKYSEIIQKIRTQPQPIRKELKPSVSVPQAVKVSPQPEHFSKMPVEKKIITAHPLDMFLQQPGDLRAAIILKEILDPPIALWQAF